MLPDDPRHGTYAGASQHWKVPEPMCAACSVAASRRRKMNRYLRATGRSSLVPSLGTVRRIHALRRIGWSVLDIARESGVPEKTLRNPAYRGQFVHRVTHDAVSVAYEQMSMTWPAGCYHERTRRFAQRMDWAPPLAWDDPDTDEGPRSGAHSPRHLSDTKISGEYDEAVVLRVLSGEFHVPATAVERREIVARWTGSHEDLARLTGWKVERYTTREAA